MTTPARSPRPPAAAAVAKIAVDDNCSANDVAENRHGCGAATPGAGTVDDHGGGGNGADDPPNHESEHEHEVEHEHGGEHGGGHH